MSTDECVYADDLARPELSAEVVRLAEFRHNLTAELAWNFLRLHGLDVRILGGGVSLPSIIMVQPFNSPNCT